MNRTDHWKRGDHIILRDVYRGIIRSVIPVTVVEDSAERAVLHLAVGTPFCLPVDVNGQLTKDPAEFAALKELIWVGFEQLLISRPGEAHSVFMRWSGPERRVAEWYVNLQAPLQRTRLGFDSTDHALDIVISADFSEIRWKDEDHLLALIQGGHFSRAEALEFRREGERVIASALRREWPFSDGWEQWSPGPGWTIPQLPPGWDVIPP